MKMFYIGTIISLSGLAIYAIGNYSDAEQTMTDLVRLKKEKGAT